MQECWTVLFRAGMMFLIMLAGSWAARRRWLEPRTGQAVATLVVQAALPALVFTQMLECVTAESLRQTWYVPLLGICTLTAAAGTGRVLLRLFHVPEASVGTFLLLISSPNWVYLPLPIAEALYGDQGIRFVLLFNVGAQIAFWTLGPGLLAGHRIAGTVAAFWRNPGLMATVAGIVTALVIPASKSWGDGACTGAAVMPDLIVAALRMLGSLTIPLSLLVAGAQLYEHRSFGPDGGCPAFGVLLGRLLAAPAIALGVLLLIRRMTGWGLGREDLTTFVIIASMPVAISCTVLVESYGGDRSLASRGILQTTVLSLVTAPLFVLLAQWLA